MKGRLASLMAPLLLAACQSVPAVSCDNAIRVRLAAALALRALDQVCPLQQAKALGDIR